MVEAEGGSKEETEAVTVSMEEPVEMAAVQVEMEQMEAKVVNEEEACWAEQMEGNTEVMPAADAVAVQAVEGTGAVGLAAEE